MKCTSAHPPAGAQLRASQRPLCYRRGMPRKPPTAVVADADAVYVKIPHLSQKHAALAGQIIDGIGQILSLGRQVASAMGELEGDASRALARPARRARPRGRRR